MNLHQLVLVFCFACSWAYGQTEPQLRTWSRDALRQAADPLGNDAPISVGSLQKPFLARAWALDHPEQEPPRMVCTAASGCWNRGGHGELGLVKGLSVSCNAYFRQLATETSLRAVSEAFRREGFQGIPSTPDAAIGLPSGPPLVIRPSALLEAYARLVREPWPVGEPVRQQVLAGLRAAGHSGTASALGHPGCWAKTGTVPSADGSRTRGLVLMLDDAGRGQLAELNPGTGREAAAALGRQLRRAPLAAPQTSQGEVHTVVVRLFDLLGARRWTVRNLGSASVPARNGFLGPGSTQEMSADDWVGPGLLEISVPSTGLVRRLEGRLAVVRDRDGVKHLAAGLTPREYASGVIAAELPKAIGERRVAFGAAVLRFLALGPRHGEADVCDSTHCAWFVGRGPWMVWATPQRAMRPPLDREDAPSLITDSEWAAMVDLSRRPGPSQWSGHCGGAPLSSHAVWGDGHREIIPCPRHNLGSAASWQRLWKSSDLATAFGGPVVAMEITHPDGVWTLVVTGAKEPRNFRFDEAHRRLAQILGWDALPSPADEIQPTPQGFQVSGVGKGHRVGMCLEE